MENKEREILNLKDLSIYLNCSISKIRKLIYDNDIPFFRIGNRYMFTKAIIDKWIINKYNDINIGDYDE